MAEVIVYLTLIGHDFDPEKVTRELGVIPTEVRYKNEVLNNGKMFGHTEWSYDTGKISTYDISNSFSCIISIFSGIVNIMREVADLYQAEWSMLVYINCLDDVVPAIIIPLQVINFLSEIEAEIGFDLYK